MIAACKLCLQIRPLRDSHILPELVYRPMYDEATRSALLLDVQAGKQRVRQRGFTEPLLCDDCEQRMNRWETYFARVWLHPSESRRPVQLPEDVVTIQGLDYESFKLFHLSLVWRAGIAQSRYFSAVRLRGRAEALRVALLNADPGGANDFPFWGMALRDPKTGGWQDELMKAPEATRRRGQWIYSMIFAGASWHYHTSAHNEGREVPLMFDTSGILTLGVRNWKDNPFVKDLVSKLPLKQAGRRT